LAKAENTVAMPEAGNEDAVLVVTRNGLLFLGQDRIAPHLFHADGTPYRQREIDIIRSLTAR